MMSTPPLIQHALYDKVPFHQQIRSKGLAQRDEPKQLQPHQQKFEKRGYHANHTFVRAMFCKSVIIPATQAKLL